MTVVKSILLCALICLNAAHVAHGELRRMLMDDEDYIHNLEGKLQSMRTQIETLVSNQQNLEMENARQHLFNRNLTQKINGETGITGTHYQTVPGSGNMDDIIDVTFSTPFLKIPVVTVGISQIDASVNRNVRIEVAAQSVTLNGFQIRLRDWSDSETFHISASWIACPNK